MKAAEYGPFAHSRSASGQEEQAISKDLKLNWLQWVGIELLIMAAIGLVLGFLGPFNTFQMPVMMRLTYWVGFIIVGYAIFRPFSICARWLSEATGLSHWIGGLITSAIGALPLSILIGFAISGFRWSPYLFSDRLLPLYFQCAVIGFGIYCLMRLLFDADPSAHTDTTPRDDLSTDPQHDQAMESVTPTVPSKLHERLPTGFPEIFALGVEDHYVRVHGAGRSEMLLLRLRDAIGEMEPHEGMQVHRSWWVARDAIASSTRDGRNLRLKLSNGLEVPVSRSYVGRLKQTGWIS